MAPEEIQLTTKLIVEAKTQGELEGFESGQRATRRRFKDKFFTILEQLDKYDEKDHSSEERIKFVNELIDRV